MCFHFISHGNIHSKPDEQTSEDAYNVMNDENEVYILTGNATIFL